MRNSVHLFLALLPLSLCVEPKLAGSLGLKRLAPDGQVQLLSISAGYKEYYMLRAEVGMQISVAAVPCSGRFDIWAREGEEAPVDRASTDRFYSFESLMSEVVQQGRFFSLRLGTRTTPSAFTIAVSAAYGTTVTLQLVLQSHAPRMDVLSLDRLHWPSSSQPMSEFLWVEGYGVQVNRTIRRQIKVSMAPPNMAQITWEPAAEDESFSLYTIKSGALSDDVIIDTACGLEHAAVLPAEDSSGAVLLQEVSTPNPAYSAGLVYDESYQFAVIATVAGGRGTALQPSAVQRMGYILTNETIVPAIMCKGYSSEITDDPCSGHVPWKVRAGMNLTVHQMGITVLLARYSHKSVAAPSDACVESMAHWLCGNAFPRCVEIEYVPTAEPDDDPDNVEMAEGDMGCAGYLDPCLSQCQPIEECPQLYLTDCSSLYGQLPDPPPPYRNPEADFVSAVTADKCCNEDPATPSRMQCFGSTYKDGSTAFGQKPSIYINPRATLFCEERTSRAAHDAYVDAFTSFGWAAAVVIGLYHQ